jgi:predicted P-loop ATPase/GTPase
MVRQPSLIVQAARGGAVDRQLRRDPPAGVTSGEVVVEALEADAAGRLDAPDVGEVVMSVPAPEALLRDRDELRRAIDKAGPGAEPLVVVVEAAEELREDELAAILDAARRSRRSVILRIEADA